MECLISTFTRVTRKLDDVNELIKSFPRLEKLALSNPSGLTEQERLSLLDFPDPQLQQVNIATTTPLKKSDLIKRAIDSPEDLTSTEIDLLMKRYWLRGTSKEWTAGFQALAVLETLTPDELNHAKSRLDRIREHLYQEENEAKAINNATNEFSRRIGEKMKAQEEKTLSTLAQARPWLRQLWAENKGQKRWGYAIFTEPIFKDALARENYECRKDMFLNYALDAIRCGDSLRWKWRLQRLDWPEDIANNADKSKGAIFQKLREQFISIRDRKTGPEGTVDALDDGILRNVVLVIDKASVDSVWTSRENVDDMWVWALDPDYKADVEELSEEDRTEEYKGYMRVRLQQLVNNFYEVRRFHNEEYSMKKLWKMAKKRRNEAFVSVKDEECDMYMFRPGGFVGSAMRP